MKNLIYLIILVCTSVSCSQAPESYTNPTELESKVDSLVPETVTDSTPGVVVGVVRNGELIFRKGYGLANLTYDIPNDPEMVYNIGSVSKQFLGYAFAMLHVEGELSLDDPVNDYLNDWPAFEHEVTLRHLLSHTSGYREAYTLSNLAGRFVGIDRLTREECLNVVRNQPKLEFVPGSRYTYNSTAWVILAEILEKVTGETAEDWVTSHILKPLEMNDTQIESYVGQVIEKAAESYTQNEDGALVNQKSNRSIFGAADIFTSVQDLAKWINNFKTAELGGKDVRDLFLNPFVFNNGLNSEYGLGIGNGSYRGLRQYRHTGGHAAFVTQLSYFPDEDLGIIVISNFAGRGNFSASRIADALLEIPSTDKQDPEKNRVALASKDLERFAGLYINDRYNQSIEWTVSDNKLMAGQNELIPQSNNLFAVSGWDDKISIETPNEQTVSFTFSGEPDHIFMKVDPWNPSANELEEYVGDYWSTELETVYHFKIKNDTLTIDHRWIGEVPLSSVTEDFFETEWGFYLKFERNNKEKVTGFSINSGRTLNVKFHYQE